MAKTSLRTRWSLKNKILILYYAFKDRRTPWYAKLTAITSLIYLISPADIIPDIIPFAGYIDDILVVPFLIDLSTKLLPPEIKREAELRARKRSRKILWVIVIAAVALTVGLYFIFRK